MTASSNSTLDALLDSRLPETGGGATEYVRREDIKPILRDIIDSFLNTTDGQAASATAAGLVELATDAEALTGTDTARAVTPANVRSMVAAASDINTGTDATKWLSSDALAGSNLGTQIITLDVFGSADNVATGDGKLFYHVPAALNGMNIVSVHALNHVAGVTGQCDVQIHNVTSAADILSTVLSIDTGEVGSDTAATPAAIDAAEDDLTTNDVLRIDVDAIHSGTAPKGLSITLECRLP